MSGCDSILIINQPTGNRGDEAAHKAFVRTILEEFPDATVNVLFIDRPKEETDCLKTGLNRVGHILLSPGKLYYKFTAGALKKGLFVLSLLHPQVRRIVRLMSDADMVVNAPGGIDIGGFRNWNTLFILKLAILCRCNVSVFGRSIGPFPEFEDGLTKLQKRFDRLSKEALRRVRILTLRDRASCQEAERLRIPHTTGVDSAFLQKTHSPNPLEGQNYAVLVPNSLEWHPAYKGKVSRENAVGFFKRIAAAMAECWGRVYMLPQLSGKRLTDFDFLSETALGVDSIIVLSPDYSSEQQEAIIAGAQFVLGARYHSIVFSILGDVPSLALSYEHKIAGMLDSLGLSDRYLDISGGNLPDTEKVLEAMEYCTRIGRPGAAKKASNIALKSFYEWKNAVLGQPLVSVIIPNFNHASFLRYRIESVLVQTYRNFEIILMDDCSTDGSRQILEEYAHQEAKVSALLLNEINSGSPFAQWKKGLASARGEFVWIAESDDWCEPTFLEKMMAAFMKDPRCAVSFCRSEKVDAEGRSLGIHPNQRRMSRHILMDGMCFARKHLSHKNSIVNASSAVFRRSLALSLDNEYESFRGLGDHVFWTGMSLEGRVAFTPEVLNHFRFHSSNVTAQMKASVKGLAETARMAEYLKKQEIIGPWRYRQIAVTALYALKYRCPEGSPEQKAQVAEMFNTGLTEEFLLFLKRLKRLLFQ